MATMPLVERVEGEMVLGGAEVGSTMVLPVAAAAQAAARENVLVPMGWWGAMREAVAVEENGKTEGGAQEVRPSTLLWRALVHHLRTRTVPASR